MLLLYCRTDVSNVDCFVINILSGSCYFLASNHTKQHISLTLTESLERESNQVEQNGD